MDKNVEKMVDKLRNLPDSLLFQILLKLPTKDVVKTSLLSTKWRNLWKYVPGLDLNYDDFPEYNGFVSFVDRFFLGFRSELCLKSFRLKYKCNDCDEPEIERWINAVVKRRVEYVNVFEDSMRNDDIQIPPSIYTCGSLVRLFLDGVILSKPPGSVLLSSLKVMSLSMVTFISESAFEEMISGCPVLESLTIRRRPFDSLGVLRVCSQSLVTFTHVTGNMQLFPEEGLGVTVDAPRLEYLKLHDHRTANFVVKNSVSLDGVDIDIDWCHGKQFDPNDLLKRNMIRDFLRGISSVKIMVISSKNLKVIDDYSKCEPLPLFRNLDFLRVRFCNSRWEMLPSFLQRCPNLKALVVGSTTYLENEGMKVLIGPRCVLPSLEYVFIERPFKADMMAMKLVSFFLENSAILKLLAIRLDNSKKGKESIIIKKLHTIPRLSTSCQIVFH